MSVKIILGFILVGLACYMVGRMSARRGQNGGNEQMLQTSAMRNFNRADALNAGASKTGTLDAATLDEIKNLLHKGQTISAIKIYRERTNCGLREAKDAVESIKKTL